MSQPTLTPEQLDQMRRIAAEVAAQRANPTGPPAPQPWKVKFGDDELEARDAVELQNLLNERQRQAEAALESERIKAQAAQQQLEALQQAAAQRADKTAPTQNAAWDKENFAKLFLDDPRNAYWYLLQNDDRMKGIFAGMANEIQALKQQVNADSELRSAERFMANTPDYAPSSENFSALERVIQEHNLPWTDASLGMAWSYLKEQGLARPAEQAEPVAETVLPPSLPRRGRSTQVEPEDIASQFAEWPAEKQKAYLESLHA